MSLHLGNGRSVAETSIVAILDYELFVKVPANRHYLDLVRASGLLTETPVTARTQSVVITLERVTFSALAAKTLAARATARSVRTGGRSPRDMRRAQRRRSHRRGASGRQNPS